MLTTTTNTLEGYTVREYRGIVTGETILGANVFRDFMAGIRDFVGGRSASYEKVINDARTTALREMMDKAEQLGANAVIGVDFDYEALGKAGGMLMVAASGTAVLLD